MNTKRSIPWQAPAALGAVVLGLLLLWQFRLQSRPSAELKPTAQASWPESQPVAPPAAEPQVFAQSPDLEGAELHRGPVGDDQVEAELIAALEALDRKFRNEPVAEGWRRSTEALISDALSSESLTANQAPVPKSYEAECRTSTCRISIAYGNEMDAQMGEIFFLGDVSTVLPNAEIGRLQGDGGTTSLIIYASQGTVPRRHRSH